MRLMFFLYFSLTIFLNICKINAMPTSDKEKVSYKPDLNAVKLAILKHNSEAILNEKCNLELEIKALQNVKNVIVKFHYSKGLKNNKDNNEIEINQIDSGIAKLIPISAFVSEGSFQSIKIIISGLINKPELKKEDKFTLSERIIFLFNKKTNKFKIEDSYEAITNAYRVWNIIPEDSLRARGHSIVFQKNIANPNFIQAKPIAPEIKRCKSFDHNSLFSEIIPEDSLSAATQNIPTEGLYKPKNVK